MGLVGFNRVLISNQSTNWYSWYDIHFSAKEDYFCVSLLYSKDNRWGRSPMVYLISWWFLRRFNLLRQIYVGVTNMSLCDCLSYNTFNCTSVLLLIVFLTWYELTSYSILLPISISALVFRLWSICFRCIVLSPHIYVGVTNMSFCEHLSYNPFNRTYVIFIIVFLTWYDLTSYSIVLPISISALVFWLWSICFRSIIFYVPFVW